MEQLLSKCENGNGQHPVTPGPYHLFDLKKSGLTDETIQAAGFRSLANRDEIASLLGWRNWPRSGGACLEIPYFDEAGRVVLRRLKLDRPRKHRGKEAKYLSPSGSTCRIYFPPGVREAIAEKDPAKRELLVTEGEKKSLKANQDGFPCIGLQGVDCWHPKRSMALLPDLERIDWRGREVYIAFDSDAASNQNVADNESLLADALKNRGAKVKVVRLPAGPNGEKVGLDDFLVAHSIGDLRKLLNEAEAPEPPDDGTVKMPAADIVPELEAEAFLDKTKKNDHPRLWYWRETFQTWERSRYRDKPDSEVRASITRFINDAYFKVNMGAVSNVLDQVKAQAILSGRLEPPVWLNEVPGSDWPPDELLVAKNKIIHLPSVIAGKDYSVPVTPALFNTVALDFDFVDRDKVPLPQRWFRFLKELWPNDPEPIEALQLWFGYCLTTDTRQQKMLGLFGPKRSGKGTIARVQTALIGPDNVASPTLSSFAQNFGLWPLIGKAMAIISDARLSGRADAAVIVERILSITGEDGITIDRKNLPPITCKLPTRIVLLSNELPRLADASGAIVSRMVVLQLTESFFGREDADLFDTLATELPGILWWAIDGWGKLKERGKLLQPQSGAEMIQELEDLGSPVKAFLDERCIVGPDYRVSRSNLYGSYTARRRH